MAELTNELRSRLRDSSFAYIDRDGDRHLPIHDVEHVRNAIARFDQTDFDTKAEQHSAARRVMAAAKRFDVEVDAESDVAKAAKA